MIGAVLPAWYARLVFADEQEKQARAGKRISPIHEIVMGFGSRRAVVWKDAMKAKAWRKRLVQFRPAVPSFRSHSLRAYTPDSRLRTLLSSTSGDIRGKTGESVGNVSPILVECGCPVILSHIGSDSNALATSQRYLANESRLGWI